jgi:hypothetical protein
MHIGILEHFNVSQFCLIHFGAVSDELVAGQTSLIEEQDGQLPLSPGEIVWVWAQSLKKATFNGELSRTSIKIIKRCWKAHTFSQVLEESSDGWCGGHKASNAMQMQYPSGAPRISALARRETCRLVGFQHQQSTRFQEDLLLRNR